MADPSDPRLIDGLRRAFDFAALEDEVLARLVRASDVMRLRAGQTLFEKGSDADGLYVVIAGLIRIFDVIHGNDRDIAMIGPGDLTGELSLVLRTPRTRSAEAKEDSEVLRLPVAAFEELSTEHPHLGAQLIEVFEERMERREAAAEPD